MLRAPLRGRRAEALVVDVVGDGGMLATDRAFRVTPQPDLTEAAFERVVEKVAAHERLADPEEQLDRLRRLNGADNTRKHTEDTCLGARRRELRRRRLGE